MLFFFLIDCAKISIKLNGRATNMTLNITDNIAEGTCISDTELNVIEYTLMHEAISKGKNVRIRVCSKNL